jgi:UDP-glucose 4-epimerase
VRAVVTGGAGFIGSNLVDALVQRGDQVVVVDDLSSGKRGYVNAAATFIEDDIRKGIDAAGADVVFHLAAQADVQTSMRRPGHDATVNVVGTVQVLEAARAAGAHVVFSSTGGAIYGECDGPAQEDGPLQPVSPYGIAKLCAEEYLRGWNRIYDSGHVVLRFANV